MRVYEQEAIAMAAFETIGIPVAKLIMYGHDDECSHILMTRIPLRGRIANNRAEIEECRPHRII